MAEKQTASALTLAGNIDREVFLRFAAFDTFVRKKAWRNPALFAAILTGFALVCFAGRKTHAQAVLVGSVLLGVGLLLPLVWLGMFYASVSAQARRSGLSAAKAQYYVTLFPERIHVRKGNEEADYPWDEVYRAYRVRGCLYLYVSASRAFLLPECESSDRAWEIIAASLPPEKVVKKQR